MELPRRKGDELLPPGALRDLVGRLRILSRSHDLATVIACAFDRQTRMLPFIYADMNMAPAGVRAIGSALVDSGFEKTRIVLQQWNRNFRPSEMRLDGRIPDLFLVSSMQIHTAEFKELLRDACRIDAAHRPLIIAGGPKAIYEPWDCFNVDPRGQFGADVAVTGEEYVLLSLLEILLSLRGSRESLRSAFFRAKEAGLLDGIPGLVYPVTEQADVATELVDTGIQRLVGNLDELPHPMLGYRILETPSRRTTLSAPVPDHRIRRLTPISSLVLTFGCKFSCAYCPIPAYNQRQHRLKSGARIEDEMLRIREAFGITFFFGADDNFFNNRQRTLEICETLAKGPVAERHPAGRIKWGTEVTVHDTVAMGHDNLRVVRRAGVRALWLGVEDMTATLVRKGQSVDKTTEAFQLLSGLGIMPMPMMMHHDSQPLYTPGKLYGLLNQVNHLRKNGAITMQVTMLSPATGSKLYEETFESGLAYEKVGNRKVENHMRDANYVIASRAPKPWKKQFNILVAYLFFYNPIRFLVALVRSKSRYWFADSFIQLCGIYGVMHNIRRTFGWMLQLMRGKITRTTHVPRSPLPMRSPEGSEAPHALPGTPVSLRFNRASTAGAPTTTVPGARG